MIKTIFYKNTSCPKKNRYNWVGIVDKNGRMLKNHFIKEADEFFEHIYETTISASDMLLDDAMFQLGVNNKMKRFFKVVSPRVWAEYLLPIKRERGRYKNSNVYIFQNFYDAFHNSETYIKGSVLWMICTLGVLRDWMPYIDGIRIMRVNHDFVEMFGEDNVYPESFDEIIGETFYSDGKVKSPVSEKRKARAELKSSNIEKKVEILPNGMTLVRENDYKEAKTAVIPDIIDYCFVSYRRHVGVDKPAAPMEKQSVRNLRRSFRGQSLSNSEQAKITR